MSFESRRTTDRLLALVVSLLVLIPFSCKSRVGEYEIAKLDLGQHRSMEILASEKMEVSQAFYLQVTIDREIVVPLFRICSGYDTGSLKFNAIMAKNGNVVGVFEQRFPNEILALHDFTSNRTWPRDFFKSVDESERLKDELLQNLQAEHRDLLLKTGTRGCN